MRSRSAPWRAAATMAFAAFALRVAGMYLLHTYRFPAEHDHYLFGTEMGRIARSLVTGHGFASPLYGNTGPTAMVGPIYPLLIAAAFKLLGVYTTASAVTLLTFNALCSALTAPVVYLIGRDAFDERVAAWACWIWVLFPFAIYWPIVWVWDTGLSALLFGLIFLWTLRFERAMRAPAAATWGAAWGILVLTNTTFLPLLPALLAWLCCAQARRGAPWGRGAAAAVLAFGIVLSPWLVRNYAVFGRVVLRTNLGLELVQGYAAGTAAPRAYWLHPADNPAEMARYRALGEIRYMAEKQREAAAFITRHPAAFVEITAGHVASFWLGVESPVRFWHFPEIMFGLPGLVALAGLGAALARRSRAAVPLGSVAALFPLVYYVTHPAPRFRYLIEPELFVLTAYGGRVLLGLGRASLSADGRSSPGRNGALRASGEAPAVRNTQEQARLVPREDIHRRVNL